MFICHECNNEYKTKRSLDIHLTKKNKCNITTPYKCSDCNKYFKHNKNLIEHQIKQICKTDDEIKNKTTYNNELDIILTSIEPDLISDLIFCSNCNLS